MEGGGGGGELNANVRSRIRVVVLSARGELPSGGDAFLFGDYFLSRFVFFTRLHPKLRNPNFYIHVTPPRAATAKKKEEKRQLRHTGKWRESERVENFLPFLSRDMVFD